MHLLNALGKDGRMHNELLAKRWAMNDHVAELMAAILHGDAGTVAALIGEGVEVNPRIVRHDARFCTPPLSAAAEAGRVDIVEMLIRAGADLTATDAAGSSALHEAVASSKAEVCQVLIRRGADVNARDVRGHTPLVDAIRNGNDYVFDILIEGGADVAVRSKLDVTPLHFAAAHGRVNMGRRLLELGAPAHVLARVHAPNSDTTWFSMGGRGEFTPLLAAVHSQSLELCRMLVAHGADPSFRQKRMRPGGPRATPSPVQDAIDAKRYDIARFFILECDIDLAQTSISQGSLSELARFDRRILEWLRVTETQQSVSVAVGATAGTLGAEVRQSVAVGPL
jgi:ankyrin repeat protein